MNDTASRIIERLKSRGAWIGARLTEDGYVNQIMVNVGGECYALDEREATEAAARRLADIAGVDTSDIPPSE